MLIRTFCMEMFVFLVCDRPNDEQCETQSLLDLQFFCTLILNNFQPYANPFTRKVSSPVNLCLCLGFIIFNIP